MKFVSTRSPQPAVSFSESLKAGLAPDGGLFVPESFPVADVESLKALAVSDDVISIAKFGAQVLRPFLKDDVLESFLDAICVKALTFPLPLRWIQPDLAFLELFHGPTAAFKDVGAQFLASCLSPLRPGAPQTVLVATSGDTGGAVAGALHSRSEIEVFILFPRGKISPRQEKQLTCWGGNIRAFSVRGTFDDCQRMVKTALRDPDLKLQRNFITANSIGLGRLLPQMIYYAKSSLSYQAKTGQVPGFIVPTGNLGNAMAALWAKQMGFPIRKVVLATNANHSIADYFASGAWNPHPTVATLANAMDVGDPSNMERLRHLYPRMEDLRRDVAVVSVSDSEISKTIQKAMSEWGVVLCPHTATAAYAYEQVGGHDWILVATAHPAKFESIVEPLIKQSIPIPPELAAMLNRPSQSTEISADFEAFKRVLEKG